jgi:putative FmdB family regulatory protein
MPTYEYRCPDGHEFERFAKMSESAAELSCPVCGKPAARRLSGGAGLVFKGSGFYLTDYGKNAHRKGGGETVASGEKKSGDSSAGQAGQSDSRSAETKASDGQSTNSKPAETRSGDSKSGGSNSGQSNSGQSNPGDAKSGKSKSAAPKSGESQPTGSKSSASPGPSGAKTEK